MPPEALVLEPVASGWLAHTVQGALRFFPGLAPSATPEMLREFAAALASSPALSSGQPLVLLADAGPGIPFCSVSHARLIAVTSRTLALGELAPPDWLQFVVLDVTESPRAAALTRTGDKLCEMTLTSTEPTQIAAFLNMTATRHVLIRAETPGDVELVVRELREQCGDGVTIEALTDPRAHLAGARRLAGKVPPQTGVWQVAPGQLRIAAQRDAAYTLYRPKRPVFALGEDTLARVAGGRPVFFVLDQEVEALYGSTIRRYGLERLNVAGEVVHSGREADKTLDGVEEICRAAYHAGLPRDGIIIAVGGGVVLDLAGFAASAFRRGVSYVRIPTTLIGLVDVAIGVKQAANAFGAKNLLGSFYPPLASILDYGFLETLPMPALSAGFAEILKMAVICDHELLDDVEQYGSCLIASRFRSPRSAGQRIAERAELLMAEQLAGNLFEQSLERAVDFGHTFSPVIETASNYRISHGHAVALDMLLSTSIAVQRELCDADLLLRLARIVSSLSLPPWPDGMPSVLQLQEALVAARRHRGGALNLVVPVRAGAVVFVQEVSPGELARAMSDLQQSVNFVSGRVDLQPLRAEESGPHASLGV